MKEYIEKRPHTSFKEHLKAMATGLALLAFCALFIVSLAVLQGILQ